MESQLQLGDLCSHVFYKPEILKSPIAIVIWPGNALIWSRLTFSFLNRSLRRPSWYVVHRHSPVLLSLWSFVKAMPLFWYPYFIRLEHIYTHLTTELHYFSWTVRYFYYKYWLFNCSNYLRQPIIPQRLQAIQIPTHTTLPQINPLAPRQFWPRSSSTRVKTPGL